jgi:hypothetical protein
MDSVGIGFRVALITLILVIVVGTIGFMLLEDLSLSDAFYFSIVTVTTVGYGDIFPLSETGKMFSIVIIILGVAGFLGIVTNGTEMIVETREKQSKKEKMNMVIGTFFSEIGLELLNKFSNADPEIDRIRESLIIKEEFSENKFSEIKSRLKSYSHTVDIDHIDFDKLKSFLVGKRSLCVGFLELPTLLEHEEFTETLRAVFHLLEELAYRKEVEGLPKSDLEHLKKDIDRVYDPLVHHWIDNIEYMKRSYPYLFSLAIRVNPFDPDRSPIVQ